MTEEQKKEVAVFRYGIIADFVGATRLDRGEQEELLRDKCARKWHIPYSGRTSLSRSTILRWVRFYNEGNGKLESLSSQCTYEKESKSSYTANDSPNRQLAFL